MMLILVVYAFLIDTNVIADPESVPTKNGLSSIILLNACSQDPPYFVSCIISFGDVELYRSATLDYAKKSYFHYRNTTNGLRVTIFKHINRQDPGTVICTKTLGRDGNHCFAVSGRYLTPKISNKNVQNCMAIQKIFSSLRVQNDAFLIVSVQLNTNTNVFEKEVFPFCTEDLPFEVEEDSVKQNPQTFSIFKRTTPREKSMEVIIEGVRLQSMDVCLKIEGSYEEPKIYPIFCDIVWEESKEVSSSTTSFNPMILRPFRLPSEPRNSREPFLVLPVNTTRIPPSEPHKLEPIVVPPTN